MTGPGDGSVEPGTPEKVKDEATGIQKPPPPATPAKPRQMNNALWSFLVAAVLSAVFLFALDITIVANIQPRIVFDLGEVDKLPWISVALALSGIATNLTWGRLYGSFNVKWLLIIAILLFEIGSAICGAAPTMNALIVGRATAGVGAIGTYVGCINVIAIMTTIQERPVYLSLITITFGMGTVLGPIIGGAFSDSRATWRWSFYINLCIGGFFAPAYLWLLPSRNPQPNISFWKRLYQLDWVGIIVFIGATASGFMAISFGGALYPWSSGRIIGLFCCSGALWIIFSIQQGFHLLTSLEKQLFPVRFLKSLEMCLLFAQTAAASTATFVPVYFIPIYFEFARNNTALGSGVRLLPFAILRAFTILANGILMKKYGYVMPWFLAGGIFCVVGSALLYTVDLTSSTGKIYGYSVILGIGAGAFNQAAFPVAQARNEPKLIPQAIAFITCGQMAGAAFSLSVANSIFINRATSMIAEVLPNSTLNELQQAILGVGWNFIDSLDDSRRIRVLEAIVKAIDDTYATVIAAGALATVMAVFMKREKLFQANK